MAKRHARYRLIKIHRNYSVEEAARVLQIHKNTVRAWIKEGLPVCDSQRPTLILGRELFDFLRARRIKNKRSCQPGEFYCFRCRRSRPPAGGMVDCKPGANGTGHLQAICPECFCVMNRTVSLSKLEQFSSVWTVTVVQGQEELSRMSEPSLNRDLGKEA